VALPGLSDVLPGDSVMELSVAADGDHGGVGEAVVTW